MSRHRTPALIPLALVSILGLLATGCGGDDEAATPANDTSTTVVGSEPDGSNTTAAPSDAPDMPDAPRPGEDAVGTVRFWVDALAEGDLETAWDLVAEDSREAIGGFEAFGDLRSTLAEGFGAWGQAGEEAFSAVTLDNGDEEISVVILAGTIAQEGPPSPAADAVPARNTADGWRVDPFVDLGTVEHQPPPGVTLAAEPTLVAAVPTGVDVRFILDGGEPLVPETEDVGGDQQRASLTPSESLEAGPHSLTVVLTNAEGQLSTSTVWYSVGG